MPLSAWTKAAAAGALALVLGGCVSPHGDTAAEKRSNAQLMRRETLAELYRIHPAARAQIRDAVGYGVFSNVDLKVVLLSAGNGWGVVRDNRTGRDVYMKMLSAGVGIGLGVKDFRGVFVFTKREALNSFVESGWDASLQADAAAKSGDKGGAWTGATDVAPGIKLYQITRHGLALQATVQGTKYWPDDDLNNS